MLKASLMFPIDDVLRLAEDAVAPLADGDTRKGVYEQIHDADGNRLDNPEIGPALHWAKDEGTYLMSNVWRAGTQGPSSLNNPGPVYARLNGITLDEDERETIEQVLGGDDFAEALDLCDEHNLYGAIKAAADDGCRYFVLDVEVHGEGFTLGFAR